MGNFMVIANIFLVGSASLAGRLLTRQSPMKPAGYRRYYFVFIGRAGTFVAMVALSGNMG
jgi:hypothetical protein